MKISMIGYGNMGKALCHSWLSHPDFFVKVAAPSLDTAQISAQLSTYSNNVAVLSETDILILAVKPPQMESVLAEIKLHLSSSTLILSIAAGLNLSWFAHHLPPKTPMIRAMPNMAASCGQSATPLLANQWVNATQRDLATVLFSQCGKTAWIQNESELDVLTALAGSGLAYLFLFAQAMCDGAGTLGLSPELASTFTIQTLTGAAGLAQLRQHSLLELQQQITSKGGTTAAALDVFANQQLNQIVLAAMQAAVTRSQTLRNEVQ